MSRKLLDPAVKAEVRSHRADVQLLLVSKEEVPPEQQGWIPSLDREDPPDLLHIKEEQEELWTSLEGEKLQGLEEADITKFMFTADPVKSEEHDEEKPQSSQLYYTDEMKTEAEDIGGPEPDRNCNLDSNLQPNTDDEKSHCSEPETDDSRDWEEASERQSGLNPVRDNKHPECDSGKTPVSSSQCATSCDHKENLQEQSEGQTRTKPFSCSVCGKRYLRKKTLTTHMRLHSDWKSFSCSICLKTFPLRGDVERHMRIHTGEKPFSCSVCDTRFSRKEHLREHIKTHTGEKPFSCSVCGRRFSQNSNLTTHLRAHTGEKPFTCSVCRASFKDSGNLSTHMRTHTGEKPFICSFCGKGFAESGSLSRHRRIHTGEKPFHCSVCGKSFNQLPHMKIHKCAGDSSGSN